MDDLRLTTCAWRGLPAWTVNGDVLNVVVTAQGGHIAALRRNGEELNPLWQPQWSAVDPAARSGMNFPGDEGIQLAATVGHQLCLDRFGPSWSGDGRPTHGEAGLVRWTCAQAESTLVEWAAELPVAGLRVRKRLQLVGDECQLTHGVWHAGPAVRDLEWAERIALGGDFLDGARFTAGIDRVTTWPATAEAGSRFSHVPPDAGVSMEHALAMPVSNAPPCGDVLAGRVSAGWWSGDNAALRRRLSCRWDPADFPWLSLWTQHRSRTASPWQGRERVRALSPSTKPFPEGASPASRSPMYQDRPTVCRIPPGTWTEHPLRLRWEVT